MTTPKDTGGPAFPFGQTDSISGQLVNGWGSDGMTLRDYFAAKAMQSYLTSPDRDDFECKQWADAAYMVADAMLEARK